MSSVRYIKQQVADLGDLVEKAWTGSGFKNLEQDYRQKRKWLYTLARIIGPPPSFLDNAGDLWSLWNDHVKDSMPTYDERRKFLKANYTDHYAKVLSGLTDQPFEEALASRDLLILDEIGVGGYGVVFSAQHVILGEARAIKRLQPLFATPHEETKALQRFARETGILARIQHPNIVRIYDAGVAGDYPYFVMEFVEGRDLALSETKRWLF